MLAKVQFKDTKYGNSDIYVNLLNKFDTVANGKHKCGYYVIKQKQLERHDHVISLDYAEMIELYKTSKDVEAFQKAVVERVMAQAY